MKNNIIHHECDNCGSHLQLIETPDQDYAIECSYCGKTPDNILEIEGEVIESLQIL